MGPLLSHSILLSTALIFPSLIKLCAAQLSSCDDVGCPLDQYDQSSCVIGNTTAGALGISNFTSPLSSERLTWTIAVQSINGTDSTFERDFFLGTPPGLNLTAAGRPSEIEACALFFEGVAAKTTFPGTDHENDQGTCSDALSKSCVSSLRTHALASLSSIRTNSISTASVCDQLSHAFRDQTTTNSCTVASSGWGTILARPLTGPLAAPFVQQGECHPTTGGKDYNLELVAANRLDAPSRNIDELDPILFGVTPIMTITYGGNVSEPAVDLSCLKTIGMSPNTTTTNQKNGAAGQHVPGKQNVLLYGALGLCTCLIPSFLGADLV